MDSVKTDFFLTPQGPTTPAVMPPAPLGSPEHSHGGELKAVLSPTHNGFNSVPNYVAHRQKSETIIHDHPDGKPSKDMKLQSNILKHHSTGISLKSSDNLKHKSSNLTKQKESDPSKHKLHHISHSKPKDSSSSKNSLVKLHSSKLNDTSKPKEHDKEKKHSSYSMKTKEIVSKLDNDISKHGDDHSKFEDISKKEPQRSKETKEEDKGKREGEKNKPCNHKSKESTLKTKEKFKDAKDREEDKFKEKELKEVKIRDKDKEQRDKFKERKEGDKLRDGKIKLKSKDGKDNDGITKEKDKLNDKSRDEVKDTSAKDRNLVSKIRVENDASLNKKLVLKVKDPTLKVKESFEDHTLIKEEKEKFKEGSIKEKDKIKDSGDKSKERIKDKSPVKDNNFDSKIKAEYKSDSNKIIILKTKEPHVLKNKEPVENHITIKEEPLSEDDVPLSTRKSQKETKVKPTKHIKREKDESDDEPLSVRADKVKRQKGDVTVNKKRKHEDSFEKPIKKVKKDKENKNIQQAEIPSPKKRGKQKEEEQEVWKWWEEEKYEDGIKWKTLEHQGPVFAPLYERLPKHVKFYYNGKPMELSEATEEVAGFYAVMLEHEYTTKESFNKNFYKDWKKAMTPEEREIITDIGKCGFKEIHAYYKKKSEDRKNMSKEDKLELRKQNEELQKKYGFCIIDGHKQKIANFKIEPPGLFRGRGEHPKMGMLKKRVQPEDVIINIGKEVPIPDAPEGHRWKEVRHDRHVTWLASWTENIHGQTKYIMLNPSSKLKGEKDWQKYETARKLKSRVDKIRQDYKEDWKSKEMKVRQRAVALYFIDKLALRAGNEKEEGETADTVGCCSLRVEHITLCEEDNGEQYVVKFDFLGKDSIRYINSIPVEKRVFKNLKLFMENKQPGDDLFDRLNTAILNKYLNELMEGLTAKVFRTFNASKTLQEQLGLLTKSEMSIPEKILAYNRANRAVAILCNHQRSVPKTFSKTMENLQKKIDEKLDQIKEFKKDLKKAKQMYKDSNNVKDKQLYEKKKNRLKSLEEQLKKLEVQATDKEENKQIALGTSKLNYLDPRISVAWCKKWDVPLEKIYNRTQRDKFRWAIEMAGPDFKF